MLLQVSKAGNERDRSVEIDPSAMPNFKIKVGQAGRQAAGCGLLSG